MEIEVKLEINKVIRSYKDTNAFILSLQKQLKSGKYVTRVDYNGKKVKTLSDKQYDAAIGILDLKL